MTVSSRTAATQLEAIRWPNVERGNYLKAVARSLRNGFLTEGPETDALEREFALWIAGQVAAVAVNGGTQAIEACLYAAGVGNGLVVAPALTFAGSVLPAYAAGCDVVYADVDPETYCITPETVEVALAPLLKKPQAIILVHLHGYPVDVTPFFALAPVVIEDCAQAWGARLRGRHVGLSGYSAWSLNRTKTVFAGEGGLALFRDPLDASHVRRYRRFGEEAGGDVCMERGGNLKMTEMAAAVARESLREADDAIYCAGMAAVYLRDACEQAGYLSPPASPLDGEHAWHKFRVRPRYGLHRDDAMRALRRAKVPCCIWQSRALPDHPAFDEPAWPSIVPNAREAAARTFVIGEEQNPLAAWPEPVAYEVAQRIIKSKEYV